MAYVRPPTNAGRGILASDTGASPGGGGASSQPTPTWDDSDMRRRSRIITRIYPRMKKNPKLVQILAGMNIPDDHLAESVQRTAGFQMIQTGAKKLVKQDGDAQRQFWDGADKTTRRLYKQAGYKGPPEAPPRPSLLEQGLDTLTELPGLKSIKDIVTEGDPLKAIADAPVPVVGGLAEAARGGDVGDVLLRSTGLPQLVNSTTRTVGGGADIVGQVGGGALRDVGLADVAGGLRSASNFAEKDVVAPVLQGMNDVGGLPQQLYRTNQELQRADAARNRTAQGQDVTGPNGIRKPFELTPQEQPGVAGFAGHAVGALIGLITGDDEPVDQFTDAWEKTAVGERYFNDQAVWDASQALDGDPFSLEVAKSMAGGSSMEDIAKRYGPVDSPEFTKQFARIAGITMSAPFGKAMKHLSTGRVSQGQDLARSLSIPLDSEGGQLFATGTDMIVSWVADPLLAAGKVRAAWKLKDAISFEEGIKVAQAADSAKLAETIGTDWESKLNAGEISFGQVAQQARRSATAADWASVIRGVRDRTLEEGALHDYFMARYPRFAKTLGPLLDHHFELLHENKILAAADKGAPLTAEEAAAVPGIQSSQDVWNFYDSLRGRTMFASGRWAPGEMGNFYLPSLSRTSRAVGAVRATMTRTIEDLAARGAGTPLADVGEMRTAAAAAPDVADGYTRLYRVQAGPELFGASEHGRQLGPRLWYDDIERARQEGMGLGHYGHFGYTDVKDADLVEHFSDVTDDALREQGARDFLSSEDFKPEPKILGQVGDFANIEGKVQPTAGGLLAAPARLVQYLMARVPEGRTIQLWGPDTAPQLARILDMEYGGASKAQLFDRIMLMDNPTLRREGIRAALDKIFYSNGLYIADEGRTVGQKYVNAVNQRYSSSDVDLLSQGTGYSPAAILPYADHGDEIQIPMYKEMSNAAKQMGVLHRTLGPSQTEFLDAAMGKFWKPAMLFRFGFAPRAVAEEAIVTLLRAPHVYTEGALLKAAKAGGEPVLTYRDLSRLAKGMDIHLPGEIINNAAMTPFEKFGEWLPRYAQGWMRGGAKFFLDEQTMKGMQLLARDPAIQHSVVQGMMHIGSTRSNWGVAEKIFSRAEELGIEGPEAWFMIATSTDGAKAIEEARLAGTTPRPGTKGVAYATHDVSNHRVYTAMDGDLRAVWVNQAGRAMGDHVMRALADGRSLFVSEGQAAAAAGALRRYGYVPDVGQLDHDVVRAANQVMRANPEFRTSFEEYLSLRNRGERAGDAELVYENLQRLATESHDPRLTAIADGVHAMDNNTAYTLLTDKDRVLAHMHNPHPDPEEWERAMSGPTFTSSPDAYFANLVDQLPEVAPGKVRVYGRRGGAADEATIRAHAKRLFAGEEGAVAGTTPWKYVTEDPNELKSLVMEDRARAAAGETTTTQDLFYADVWKDDLRYDVGDAKSRAFLTLDHTDDVVPFADVGRELDDVRNWSKGVDGNRARQWDLLAEKAMGGDATAAEELGQALAERQLQHPDTLRNFREMTRGVQDSAGNLVQYPPREGMARVYFPTFKADEADAAFTALPQNDTVARRFARGREDLSGAALDQMESVGDGPLFAHSRYASTDPKAIRGLVEEMETNARAVGQDLTIGVSYVDVPEQRVKSFWKNRRMAGSHEYEINIGESLTGVPIDYQGKVINVERTHLGVPAAGKDATDFEAAGKWLDDIVATVDPKAANYEQAVDDAITVAVNNTAHLTPEQQRWVTNGWVSGDDPLGHYNDLYYQRETANQLLESNGISFEDAAKDAARVMNQRFDELFTVDGKVMHEVTLPGAKAGDVDPEIGFDPRVSIPEMMNGPSLYVPPEEGLLYSLMNKGFDKVLTPLVNAISRTPLYINNAARRVALSEELLRPMIEDVRLVGNAQRMAKSLGIESTEALYNQMWNMPTARAEVVKLVESNQLSKKWLELSDHDWRMLHAWKENERLVQKAVGEAATTGALNDTIPYIDDHHVRSQFSDEVRNLIPFWWAQEAFFRRWAGTISHSPEAIRKAQLIMQGGRHAGFIYKDEDGNDTFMVPLSDVAMKAIGGAISTFTGGPFSIPVPVGISGQVRLATPGFDAVGVPGFGPLAGIPLALTRRMFPEIEAVEKGLLGERGAGHNELEQIFPSWVVKGIEAFHTSGERDTQDMSVASSAIQAMQYLEANGHGLPENATVHERQDWIDNVTHWARSMQVARVVFGWFDPAPAQLEVGTPQVTAELVGLLKHMTIEDAVSLMAKKYPNATPYTVFSSKSASGALLPRTQAALDFMNDNHDFIDRLPYAAAFMLPQSKAKEDSIRSVHALQLELGLREQRTPESWYEDFKFGQSSDVYFSSSKAYELEREKIDTPKARAEFDRQWSDWKKHYFEQHPVFADELQTRSGQQRRERVMDEMRLAFADPHLPQFEHRHELKTMVESYDGYLHEMEKMKGKRGAHIQDARSTFRQDFADWASRYVVEHPEMRNFYQRVVLPDLDLSASQEQKFSGDLVTTSK